MDVRVQTAYNKLDRTRQMVAVVAGTACHPLGGPASFRTAATTGTYLCSQTDAAAAQEFEAQTLLLQSKLEFAQAQDELTNAIGETAQ